MVDQAEELVRGLAAELTRVRADECLCCYVARQLDDFPCDGTHRHVLRFQADAAPRATALLQRLGRVGACCCDCELFLNGYELDRRFWAPEGGAAGDDDDVLDTAPPEQLPPCAGVRRGSAQPCSNWVRLRRW
jgi:hypothetical protein